MCDVAEDERRAESARQSEDESNFFHALMDALRVNYRRPLRCRGRKIALDGSLL